jgi:multidrug efflux system membrane fusion protein
MRRATTLAVVITGGLLLTGCSGTPGTPAAAPREASDVPVTVALAKRKDMPVEVRAIGSVEAYSTVGVKSQVAGELVGVHFKEGQDVRKGDLLFTIDPRPFEAEVERQKSTLERDQAQAENQRAQARRYEQLLTEGVISREMFEQVRTNADALEAAVRADQAALEAARLSLQYTRIHAPIDGRTGSLMIHQGNMVKENDTIDLVTIHQITPIYVSFSVPEQYLGQVNRFLARGLKVKTTVPGRSGALEGTVSFVNNTVDVSTAMIRLKAVFANAGRHLWPGQFADVLMTLNIEPGVLVVPSEAVQTGPNGDFVFVVDANRTAQLRPVTVARTVNGEAIIAKGVEAGEQVVTDGQVRLAPSGTRVEIKPAAGTEPHPQESKAARPQPVPPASSERHGL